MGQRTASAESRKRGVGLGKVTVGIDVNDRYSHLCVLGDDGEVVREQRVRTTEQELAGALAGVPGARVVMEVGPRSPWMNRMSTKLGHEVIVGALTPATPKTVGFASGNTDAAQRRPGR